MKTTSTEIKITHKTRTSKGSGRTKGAYSFVRVPWATLKRFVGKDSHVTVSRLWADNIGLHSGLCTRAETIHKNRFA